MLTEEILTVKRVPTVLGKVLITTNKNTTVWADEDDYTAQATKVSFITHKAGDEYTKKDGTKAKALKDGHLFVGFNVIKEGASLERKFQLAAKYGVAMA